MDSFRGICCRLGQSRRAGLYRQSASHKEKIEPSACEHWPVANLLSDRCKQLSGRLTPFRSSKAENFVIFCLLLLINLQLAAPTTTTFTNNRYSSYTQPQPPAYFHHQPIYPQHTCHHPDDFNVFPTPLLAYPPPLPPPTQPPPPLANYKPHERAQLVQLRSPTHQRPTNLVVLDHELNLLAGGGQLLELREHERKFGSNFNVLRNDDHRHKIIFNEQFIVHEQPRFLPQPKQQQQLQLQLRRQQPATIKTTTTTTETKTETETNEQLDQQRRQHQPLVTTDIDECLDERSCGRGASCENLPGSFRCSCPPGFTGDPAVECIGKYGLWRLIFPASKRRASGNHIHCGPAELGVKS